MEIDRVGTQSNSEVEALIRPSEDAGRKINAAVLSAQDAGRRIASGFRDVADFRSAVDSASPFNAALAALSAPSKVDEMFAALKAPPKIEVALSSRRMDHLRSLLRRLGVPVNLDEDRELWFHLWLAMRKMMSISEQEFWDLDPFVAAGFLEHEIWGREALEDAIVRKLALSFPVAHPSSRSGSAVAQRPRKGGRPRGTLVNGERLRELRGELSQYSLARNCGLSEDTIQRGEHGGRWPQETFEKVAGGLTAIRGRSISPDQLKK